ncbi:hypothetical protein [Streptomyces sp. NPDC002913]
MNDTPMTPDVALTRLRQYGERTSTWSTATYNDGTEKALHGIALTLASEVERLRAEAEKAACRCFDPTHHAPDCSRAHVTWLGVTYNAGNWYQDRDGEWLRPHSVNAHGELLMNVRGDSAYEPVPVSEIEAECGPLVEVPEAPYSEPWNPQPTGFPMLTARARHDARVAAETAPRDLRPGAEAARRMLRPGACDACGDIPDEWCPTCAACKRGCYSGHDGNTCTHEKAPWKATP